MAKARSSPSRACSTSRASPASSARPFGEGWVGYTPLHAGFEEGPVGAEICAHAVRKSREIGAAGVVVCSNAAPHHPMWHDVALQRRLNADFRERA